MEDRTIRLIGYDLPLILWFFGCIVSSSHIDSPEVAS